MSEPAPATSAIVEAVDRAERDDCPVLALGFDPEGSTYRFLSPSAALRPMAVRDFSANGLLSLFDGDPAWLIQNHQRHDKDGEPVNDFVVRGAAGDLMRRCHAVGIFDPHTRFRGLGVWRGPSGGPGGGAPIVHCGDAVWRDGVWATPGLRFGRELFVARARTARPDFARPASAEDAWALRRALDLWRFSTGFDADLVMGWLGQALLGSLPAWRGHLLGSAEHGAGKSKLHELIAAALGPQGETYNDYTEAGLRNAFSGEARGVLLDEAETDAGRGGGGFGGGGGPTAGRMQGVIDLIRRMSGAEGANVVRSSAAQDTRVSHVTGCALMLAVNAPPLSPQDRSRIHRFEMAKATRDPDAAERVERAIAAAHALSARLRARAVANWRVFAEAVPIWRAGLIEGGCDGRQADLLATIMAGRDVLLEEAPPDGDSVAAVVERLSAHIALLSAADVEDGDAAQAWNHLLTFVPDHWRSGQRKTLGQMILEARLDKPSAETRVALRTYGLRLHVDDSGRTTGLLVATRHQQLSRIYGGSRWGGGGWIPSLLRLGPTELVRMHDRPERFAGPKARCLWIAMGFLPEREGDQDEPMPPEEPEEPP